ncbi:MAG: alpha/beta hydrolase [Rhodoferax sp.]|uniref:alpha/beta fold hydrolase n=1 Tax=Rhodoferax sp. TaxID=50421 RepID=UPI002716D7E5|nr:alpha/beta hydrolase [Rhodoferax sp.]MDO8451198.1 alpha/beta hydrolase [Rhodoferax sp.]
MSLWLDFLGAEVRYVNTPTYGRIRIAEAGRGKPEVILFQHGLNGHLEAYAKNLLALSEKFHVIAFDYVGHGLSDKKIDEYNPLVFAEQLRELMDVLQIELAHLSGESLGGWVSGVFAAKYPQRVRRLMLNTAGGIPVVSAKGKQDMQNFMALNKANVDVVPNRATVTARMQWLMHPNNHHLLNEELIDLRLRIYLSADTRRVAPTINAVIQRHDDFLIPLESLRCETLFLWTQDNPIHDIEAARAAAARVSGSRFYVMQGDAAHWPQYEASDEFNAVTTQFFTTGQVPAQAKA